MSECLIVHNPGSRSGARAVSRLRELLAGEGGLLEGPVRWVPLPELERLESQPSRVIAVGGDGTINAAVSWLRRRELSVSLGVVPAGTGNNLARGLGLPLESEAAWRLALRGTTTRAVDAIRYRWPEADADADRLWIQSAALGFPAEIAARYDNLRRHGFFRLAFRPAGPYIYRALALLGLIGQRRNERLGTNLLEAELSAGAERLRETVLAIFLGNDGSLGGNFHPCPRARVDDAAMDVCLVRARTGMSYLKLFRAIVHGEHLAFEDTVVYWQVREPLRISLSKPCRFLADGDLWVTADRFELTVEPGRFHVVVA